MIYTSYFSSRKYNKADGVSIARWSDFWNGDTYCDLFPSKNLLVWWKSLSKELQDDDYYQQLYSTYYKKEILDELDPHKVASDLENRVLLCYEESSNFCHRHIVATWLRQYRYEVKEL